MTSNEAGLEVEPHGAIAATIRSLAQAFRSSPDLAFAASS